MAIWCYGTSNQRLKSVMAQHPMWACGLRPQKIEELSKVADLFEATVPKNLCVDDEVPHLNSNVMSLHVVNSQFSDTPKNEAHLRSDQGSLFMIVRNIPPKCGLELIYPAEMSTSSRRCHRNLALHLCIRGRVHFAFWTAVIWFPQLGDQYGTTKNGLCWYGTLPCGSILI